MPEPDYTDDLRLAHVLADDADSLTQARFKALDLHVMSKPDLTPVTDADQAVEEGIRRTLSRVRSRDAVIGEEHGHDRPQPAALDRRPDRRHQELRARRPGVGHPDRADGRRRGRGRRGVRARCCSAAGGPSAGDGAWTGRSLLKATRCQVSDVRRLEDASLSYASLSRLGRARPARRLPGPVPALLADPGLRRLLVLHAARRGRRRPRRRAGARALRHGRARRDRARGRRPVHLPRRHRRPLRRQRAGLQRPPARRGAVLPRARCPTTTDDPDDPPRGPGLGPRPARAPAPAGRGRRDRPVD